MPLWELLILSFFVPCFWFGWRWSYRLLAVAAAAKIVSSVKDKALKAFKGEGKDDDNSNG